MPQTRISCPNCRQPIVADITQLIDVSANQALKQRFVSGLINLIQCPHCGYQGHLATPLVYHDPQKELLLSYVPPEIGLPHNEQERLLGSLINQIVNRLPMEQRKGYLLRPQANLTLQSMIERVLEADGITREMIQEQQKRMNLLQRLLSTEDAEARREILKQEESLVDEVFFALFSRIMETVAQNGDQQAVDAMGAIQTELLEHTDFGQKIKNQTEEFQAAIASLQEGGKELTREKLVDIVIKAPSEDRLRALVSLVRPGMDYQFFQMLSEKIDRARDKGRQRLIELRTTLLALADQYDKQLAARRQEAAQTLDQLLKAQDVRKATEEALPAVDELFVQHLESELQRVRGSGDLERLSKLQKVQNVIEEASAPPPEVAFLEELLAAPDERARRKMLEERQEELTEQFVQILSGLTAQIEQSGQRQEVAEQLRALNRLVRRFLMEKSLRGQAQ